jgi:hypothetical protein
MIGSPQSSYHVKHSQAVWGYDRYPIVHNLDPSQHLTMTVSASSVLLTDLAQHVSASVQTNSRV